MKKHFWAGMYELEREMMNGDKISIPVIGGMMTLRFGNVCSTGTDPDTKPGIGFELTAGAQLFPSRHGTGFYGGSGVIGRKDARLLAAALIRMANEGDAAARRADHG